MIYNDLHRYLLRSVASRGVVSIFDAETYVKNYAEKHEIEFADTSIGDMIKLINDEIRPYQQTIKQTLDEISNDDILIFLSLGYDELAKVQNIFTANELEFFRTLIEDIMTSDSRQITGIRAINLVGKMKSTITKSDAQKLLGTWCRMFYLERSDNNYALGVRAIHEFESYLRQNLPDTIEECGLCKKIVFRGYNCPACAVAVHTRCLNRYLEKIQKWPCCKIDYDEQQIEDMNAPRQTQTQVDRSQRNNTNQSETVTEQDGEESISQEEELSNSLQNMADISHSATRKRKRHSTTTQSEANVSSQSESYTEQENEANVTQEDQSQDSSSENTQRVIRKRKKH